MTITLFFCQSNTFEIIKVSIMTDISSRAMDFRISFVPSPNPSHPLQSFIHQLNSLWPFQHPTIIHVKHMYSLFQNFMVSHFNTFSILFYSMSDTPPPKFKLGRLYVLYCNVRTKFCEMSQSEMMSLKIQ
jgi:hypothetical protein